VIRYKDFAPKVIRRRPLKGVIEIESFSEVVSAANQWIENRLVQVMNVETVVLPLDHTESDNTNSGMHRVTQALSSPIKSYQFVRVWYKE
jgi:hypothetical protein